MIQKAEMRLESGTCNVCSAPCSSCMHLNRALMGSKTKEFSDENSRLGEANQYCTVEADGSSSPGSRACERLKKHPVNESSHKPSISSTHDSQSENVENGQALSGKYQDSKCLESLDDITSCISRTSDANLASGSQQINTDRINVSCSSTLVSHLEAERSRNGPSVDMSGLSEGCMENVDSSFTKERVPIISAGEKPVADKENLNNGIAKVSVEICPKSEADMGNNVDIAIAEDHKYSALDGLHAKVDKLIKSSGRSEPLSEDEGHESDVVEHDVKVCDICGDAGREDLLAICSRCSDGAEHTYCMREMLVKLPEGDWLCEECKCVEETANRRLVIEEKKLHKVISASQISGKRPSQSMEIATAAKRQALESSTGSPKASSPKRIVSLSRESSLKSMDKGKMKSGQQVPVRNHHGGDDVDLARSLSTGPRSQNPRSTLLKSNSFNNFNSKPRIKLVDEVVPQKQKGGVEHISKNLEKPTGMISKSMSFKSSHLGRSNTNESKVKSSFSKHGIVQDSKALRHTKELGSLDKKFQPKIDRPVIHSTMVSSVSTSKGDHKLAPLGETAKPYTVNNNREFKVNQDGKVYSLSKSMSNTGSRSPEPQVSSDKTSTSVNETQQDRLPRSHETVNHVDRTKDSSSDHVRSGVTNASKSSFCRKCKDFGHATECCSISGTQEFVAEASVTATSSSKEEMHKGNRLKAAIQAALLRRPEIHKKKEGPDETNEFPTSIIGFKREVTSQNQVLVSSTLKNSIYAEETNVKQEIVESSSFETTKCPSANDPKQLKFFQTDICSQLRKSDFVGLTSGEPVVRDLANNGMVLSSVLSKMSVIPEYEYIWQGVFEVHRNGKPPPDLYAGIQAHLSACASPKVIETVRNFSPEVSLNEVSRLSIWPSQFHQSGAKEDNIALYFFAKDTESYERHYKGLLDHMIRNDLALRGMFGGVELLIFASNQLPEDSQRWNMLFFLWGTFRGRRINHSNSTKSKCIPSLNVMPNEKDFPSAVMTLSETWCSPKRVNEESIDQGNNMPCRNFVSKGTVFGQTHLELQVKLETPDSSVNTKSTSGILITSTQLCQEMNSTGSSLGDSAPEHRQCIQSKPPEVTGTSVSRRIVETKTNPDISGKQEPSSSLEIPSVDCQIDTASNIIKDKILERTVYDENQRRPKRKQLENDLNINEEATMLQGDLDLKGANCLVPNDKKIKHIDLSDTLVEASAVSSQKRPLNVVNCKLEDTESSKKLQKSLGGVFECNESAGARVSFNGSFASLVNDLGSCSSVGKGCKEACDEKIIHEDLGTMERTFFPVDNRNKLNSGMVVNRESLNGAGEYVDQFEVGIPNLELALGGETKPSHKSMLPFFVGAVDKKINPEKTPDIERDDENVAASLSLSLSFPSSSKEHMKPVTKNEPLPTDGHNAKSSFLLFGRFTDK